MNAPNEKYVMLSKRVGETPLQCLENWRVTRKDLNLVPMAYAGRLDPMAEGKLLVLIGEECKVQENYHDLDKAYVFQVLFGVGSDSSDVLGLISEHEKHNVPQAELEAMLPRLVGEISLPYPIFSSRTVKGKPLHTWTLEGRLSEIVIPVKTSTVHELKLENYTQISRDEVYTQAVAKINLLPKVTDLRKALGQDFRREAVLAGWDKFKNTDKPTDHFTLATIYCVASSGTYMRSLAKKLGSDLKTDGLAFSINRLEIGRFYPHKKDWVLRY